MTVIGFALIVSLLGTDGQIDEFIPSIWQTEKECRAAQAQYFGRPDYFESFCVYGRYVDKDAKK